jgi:Asp-tRNA(Asn)/Glu-tRNA(Gln) amidotransferase C subunit
MSYLEKDEFVITRAELEEIEKMKEDKRKLIQTLENVLNYVEAMKTKIKLQDLVEHIEWLEAHIQVRLSKFKQG